MTYRILLAEDDASLREIITDYFSAKAADTLALTAVPDGNAALGCIQTAHFDLIMLDVMMPGMDGFALCREIRKNSDVPLLFLTARAREEDLLHGYALGCDDYVTKPFSLAALLAKVHALLNRAKGTVISHDLVVADIRMDLRTLAVTVHDEAITLAPKEFALLQFLMEHKGWTVSRDMLLDHVWGMDYFGTDRVVDSHIRKLRAALGSAGKQIRTVIGRGYQLTEQTKT